MNAINVYPPSMSRLPCSSPGHTYHIWRLQVDARGAAGPGPFRPCLWGNQRDPRAPISWRAARVLPLMAAGRCYAEPALVGCYETLAHA